MYMRIKRLGVSMMALAVGAMLITACDTGGATTATPTSIPTQAIEVPTPPPTDTAAPPTATVPAVPTETETAAPSPTVAATGTEAPLPSPSPAATASPGNPSDYTWTQVALSGQKVQALALMASGDNPALAAGPGGAWHSSYDYKTWDTLNVKPGGLSQGVAIASTDVMFVTGNMGCASGGPIQAWRTEDGGKTWKAITGPNTPLRVVVGNTQLVYGTTCTGVVQSTDNGATWTPISGSQVTNYDPGALAIGPDGQSLFVAYYSEGGSLKVMKSAAGGSSSAWADVTPKNAGEMRAPATFAVAPTTEGHPEQGGLYMATGNGQLLMLPQGASDWKVIQANNPQSDKPQVDFNITALAVDTTNTEEYNKPGPILYEARSSMSDNNQGLGVYRSADGGATWQLLGKGIESQVVNGLALSPQDPMSGANTMDVLLAATNAGIWEAPMPPPFH